VGAYFMLKTNPAIIEKCRNLRKSGFTLGQIIDSTNLPKTTVYKYISDISLSAAVKKEVLRKNTERIRKYCPYTKGKCAPGREIFKPDKLSRDLIFLISHFMFDGEINKYSCIYNNRNKKLIERMRVLMKKIFNLQPHPYFNKFTGVNRISYHHIELADYVKRKSQELIVCIKNASATEKKTFLRSFFDDEGSVHYKHNLVRGFQHNLEILRLIQNLLNDFGIKSKIDEKYQEIIISRKENITKFYNNINFSDGVYINPGRKNSIWNKKIEKRAILNNLIRKYQI
jgi:hypothetical protein